MKVSKKLAVPTLGVALGIGNELMSAGLPPWLVITCIAASVAYALIEALVDVARIKAEAQHGVGQYAKKPTGQKDTVRLERPGIPVLPTAERPD